MIEHLKILSLVIHLVLGALVISYIYQVYKTHTFPCLIPLIKYTIIINLVFILLLIGSYFTENLPEHLFSGLVAEYRGIIEMLVSLLALGMIYYMTSILISFRDIRIPSLYRKAVFLFGMIIFFGYLIRTIFPGTYSFFVWLDFLRNYIFENIVVLESLFLILSLFFWADSIEKERVRLARIFSLLYLLRYLFSFILVLIYLKFPINEWIRFAVGFVMLVLYNLLPFFWTRFFFLDYAKSMLHLIQKRVGLGEIFEKYSISKREAEIIELMLDGKSNRQIEKLLFISFHTVKNHISNIFRKLNLSSRYEMIHFFLKNSR